MRENVSSSISLRAAAESPSARHMQTTVSAENPVCGTWQLTQEIGHGAYGVVYSATGPNGEKAAVKVCNRDKTDSECYEREKRGVELYKSIPAGEGLIRLLEFGEYDWGFYAAMELADNEFERHSDELTTYRPKTLARVVAGEKALPLEATLKLGIALATGLVSLQRHHLLHRDIKPENVIFVRGQPVLSDPGFLIDETEAASFVGTPGYVPPENFTRANSDVYSLGLTLKAASFGRAVDELGKGPSLEADTENPLFPAWWRILNRATHPNATYRHRSAKALLKNLCALKRRQALSKLAQRASLYIQLLVLAVSILTFVTVVRMKLSFDNYVIQENLETRLRPSL